MPLPLGVSQAIGYNARQFYTVEDAMLSPEITQLLNPVQQFLRCETPDAWLNVAARPDSLPVLLQDHLICELNDNMCNYKCAAHNNGGR